MIFDEYFHDEQTQYITACWRQNGLCLNPNGTRETTSLTYTLGVEWLDPDFNPADIQVSIKDAYI
jgi:hypothetical protein